MTIKKVTGHVVVWSYIHSVIIILGTGIALFGLRLWILAVAGTISFLILILIAYKTWTPKSSFGWGNLLTLTRLLLVLWIAVCYTNFSNFIIIVLSMIILIADGIDGLIAERRREISIFGEYFDKETDAFYLHVLIMTAIFKGLLPQWLVFVGLFRYLFMLYLLATGQFDRKERRSAAGRYIYVFSCIAFTLPFTEISGLILPVAGLASLMLLYSFLRDIIWLHSGKSESR